MNKNDIKLIITILVIASFVFFFLFINKKEVKKAIVYYENNAVLTIDLSLDCEYNVEGYNGNVKIVVKDNKIRVSEENSPLHICSNQGWISKSYESIICLPNKIVIKFDDSELDATVR